MKSNVQEMRNAMGKLVGKLYQYKHKTEIEIVSKGCRYVITVPPGTPIKCHSSMLLTK